MRLTLRTLLALRNKTLGPDDENTLTEKVRESSYAQQLLELISSVVSNARLSALAPTATGPTDDPNVMAEYIDSTLPPEQAAEVDRTCLESPLHLAEAAGSHEVLTLVLGKPAEVPPALRDRIYGLSSYSAETLDAPSDGSQDSVAPVSLNDSGAFQAATRMQPTQVSSAGGVRPAGKRAAEPAIAGSRPLNAAEASEIFGDRLRTSRVVPWLVSLALVGVFLFVLKQAFSPLWPDNSNVAQQTVVSVDQDAANHDTTGDPETTDPETTAAMPTQTDVDAADASATQPAAVKPAPTQPPATSAPADSVVSPPDASDSPPATTPPDDAMAAASPPADAEQDAADDANAGGTSSALPKASDPAARVADASAAMIDSVPSNRVEVQQDGDASVVATSASTNQLLLGLPAGAKEWISIPNEAPISAGVTLISPPKFRNQVTVTDRYEWTLVGPTTARLDAANSAGEMFLQSGRVVVTSLAPETQITIRFGEQLATAELPEVGTTLAIEVTPFRAPGTDPTNPENHVLVSRALAVVGPVFWQLDGVAVEEIQSGQQWSQVGEGAAEKVTLETTPAWVDGGRESSIDQTARETLVSLLPIGEPVSLPLREAIQFRRAEVAALAARTLVMLGHNDVYFGTDGVLGLVSQKSYWEDHVAALKTRIDVSPEAAKDVLADAKSMDAASADSLFRMLWDYSPEQLEAGDDAFLVETLDSPQTALRVLAIEDLRRITGTSLFFKPEQEVSSRRKNDIKKWEARLRRQDIRWQTVPIAGATQ